MMSRHKDTHNHHERWLVSYADFITLLFAFFVVLYASSQVDKKRINQLSSAIQNGFQELGSFSGGAVSPAVPASPNVQSASQLDLLERELLTVLGAELARHEVAIRRGPDGLVLSLREVGFFDSGSAVMRPDGRAAFHRIASALHRGPYLIRAEGHTDDVPIHNRRFASNWELSTARATEVIRLLILEYGFGPSELSAAGYAEFHPVSDNASREGRQSNRRVDLVIQEPPPNPRPTLSR